MNTRGTDVWDEPLLAHIGPEQFSKIVTSIADLAIVLDGEGNVRTAVMNPRNSTLGPLDHWKGRDIRELLTVESIPKIDAQLAAHKAGRTASVDTIEVNHSGGEGWDFPIRYTLQKMDHDNLILMLGHDMAPMAKLQQRLVKAQFALERDYESHRHYETRYRVILEAARDALALIDVSSGRVLDVNSRAGHLLGADSETLAGAAFAQEFQDRRRGEFMEALIRAASDDPSEAVSLQTRRSDRSVTVHPLLFRAAGDQTLLCRIEIAEIGDSTTEGISKVMSALFRDGADAIVFTDSVGIIRSSNTAFLDLCEVGHMADVRGKPLSDFLSRSSIDLKVLIDGATQRKKMRLYSTRLEGIYGSQLSVELSATLLTDSEAESFAFVIRDVSRAEAVREPTNAASAAMSDDAMRNVMGLVGSAQLKDIVAATTDVVEKMCIETAVELTGNNRVAAAEMLGLSRQSLYVKLRKHGLLAKDSSD